MLPKNRFLGGRLLVVNRFSDSTYHNFLGDKSRSSIRG